MPTPNSKPINLIKAKSEIQQRKGLWNIAIGVKALLASLYPDRKVAENFYGHPGNAFLFEREVVLKHFFVDGDPDKGKTDKTHLLVVSGAHDLDEDIFKKGDPTIIIAGVKPNPDQSAEEKAKGLYEYVAAAIDEPADEYPPVQTIDDIHSIRENDNSFFIRIL